MTRNQVQLFSVIKCIEASEVTLATELAHPFTMAIRRHWLLCNECHLVLL